MSPTAHGVFGANLSYERRRRALSMRRLADLAGMHGSEISRLERGERDPRLSTMVRVSSALEVPLADLLGGVGWRGGDGPFEPRRHGNHASEQARRRRTDG